MTVPLAAAWALAEQQLHGVGDATLGEWREHGGIAVHLRRRLTVAEMKQGNIEGVRDVRGTPEHAIRISRLRPHMPAALQHLPLEDLL
jgi:hypothetical protein